MNKWNYPGNMYTPDSGLDDTGIETFKKDPLASLGRELCQNSIDARDDLSKPVRVEFKTFRIAKRVIPDIEDVENQIQNCINEWKNDNPSIYNQLVEMQECLKQKEILCARFSDFNTKGVEGVSGGDKTGWFYLTKGSGISGKRRSAGGSKGIGKYATFVASKLRMVFYSTVSKNPRTGNQEIGYEGINLLCSATIPGTDEKTRGIGYYGRNRKNEPILSKLKMDPNFVRDENSSGADVYIIGFRDEMHWKKQIVTKILDSFMYAIVNGDFECTIDDIVINKDTLKDVVYDSGIVKLKEKNNIISQYQLLTDQTIYHEPISIPSYENCAMLYIKSYAGSTKTLATNNCVMVRFPYMKIMEIKHISLVPCAAMCVIGDNQLCYDLRDIENPQHTDWEINRITDSTEKRNAIKCTIKDLENSILNMSSEYLTASDSQQTDIEGAGDFLPDPSDDNFGTSKEATKIESKISRIIKNQVIYNHGSVQDSSSLSTVPDIGTISDNGEDSPSPEGNNKGLGGEPHQSDAAGKLDDGENDVLKYEHLNGIPYRFIVKDKSKGIFVVSFCSPYSKEKCEMELYAVDDVGGKERVEIVACLLNEKQLQIQDNTVKGFEIEEGETCRFTIQTNQFRLFSSEVKLYAVR